MALPATDNFNRANNVDLGANWTPLFGELKIITNEAAQDAGDGGVRLEHWNADAFTSDHYSQAVYRSGVVGPAVRLQETDNGYYTRISTGAKRMYRFDNGTATELQTMDAAVGGASGEVYKMTIEGTTIKVFKNAVQIGTNQTDATYSGGASGVHVEGTGALDDWEGDNMGAAPARPSQLTTLGAG